MEPENTPTPHDITSAEKVAADVVYQIRETCVVMEDGECAQQYVLSFDEAQKAVAALIESQRATIESQASEIEKLSELVRFWIADSREAHDARQAAEARTTALEAEKAGLVKALRMVATWAEQRCPCHNEQPNPCPLCGASVENLEGCKAAESTMPRHVLDAVRQALSRSTEVKNDG